MVESELLQEHENFLYSNSMHPSRRPSPVDMKLHIGDKAQSSLLSENNRENERLDITDAWKPFPRPSITMSRHSTSTSRPLLLDLWMDNGEGPSNTMPRHSTNTPRPLMVDLPLNNGEGPSSFLHSPSSTSSSSTVTLQPTQSSKLTANSFSKFCRRTSSSIRERANNRFTPTVSGREKTPSPSKSAPASTTMTDLGSDTPHGRGSPDGMNTCSSNSSLGFGSLRKLMRAGTGSSKLNISAVPNQRNSPPLKLPTFHDLKGQFKRTSTRARSKAKREGDLDDIHADTFELDDLFVSSSMVPGRRGRRVGKGSTATIKTMYRRGMRKDLYAVKEFRKRSHDENENDYENRIKSEFTIARSLQHPNIVASACLCTHRGRWIHTMEYCGQGDLFSLLKHGHLKTEDKLCFFKQLLQGVAHLHSRGVAHRDIKPENLLLDDKGHLKITDFGVAVVFRGPHPGMRAAYYDCAQDPDEIRKCVPGISGSLPYIAPEVLSRDGKFWALKLVFRKGLTILSS